MIRFWAKRARQRSPLAARPMRVRNQLAWYWRALGVVAGLAISVAAALWIYDLGQRFAGADGGATREAFETLKTQVAAQEEELIRLRALTDSSDSRLQVEKTAQGQLAKQVKALEIDNARMKEDLAFFENLVPGGRDDRLSIYRFRVEASGVPGEYRYRLLVMNGTAKEVRDFRGSLQLVVDVQRDNQKAVLTLPEPRANAEGYRLNFKRVQRVEGLFRVEEGAKVRAVQVRVLEQGSPQPRATENFTLS